MVKKEYAIWGTRNGHEDIIRVNNQETQNSLLKAKKIQKIIQERGEFSNTRIQTIDLENYNIKAAFIGGIKRKR